MRILPLLAVLLTVTLTYAQDNIVLRSGEEIPAKVLEVTQTDLKYRKSANPDGPVYTAPLRDVLLIKYANGTKDVLGRSAPAFPGSAPEPTPTIGKSELATILPGMDGLRYHGGLFTHYFLTQSGQHLNGSEAHSLIETNHAALMDYRSGQSLRRWTYITAIPALALIGTGIGLLVSGEGDNQSRDGSMNGTDTADNDPATTTGNTTESTMKDGHGEGAVVGAALIGGGIVLSVTSVWLNHRATVQFRRAADRFNSRPATTLRFAPASRGLGIGATLRF